MESAEVPLSDVQRGRLAAFAALLREVAVPRGFVGERDAAEIEERHVMDSLRAAPHLTDAATVADLGSGAGLPGIPLAIALPTTRFTLIEPLRKRAAFLELAVERLGLSNVTVAIARAEDVRDTFAACVARAFAPPERSWAVARPLLEPAGRLILFIGARSDVPEPLPGASEIRIVGPEVLEMRGRIAIISAT